MNKSLLVCIAFHFVPERLKWLQKVIGNLLVSYQVPLTIIIDTNITDVSSIWEAIGTHRNVWIKSHPNLEHPFHLTRIHRIHFKERIDEFDILHYIEDDEVLPFENYIAAIEKFEFMWPMNAVPTFIRIEEADGKQYVSDIPKHQPINSFSIHEIQGRKFVPIPFPINYNGFWLIPSRYLRDNMTTDFTKMTEGREWSAMYTTWELNKKGLLEVYQQNDKWFVHPNCYSYHLPSNYIGSSMGNASIEVKNIFI